MPRLIGWRMGETPDVRRAPEIDTENEFLHPFAKSTEGLHMVRYLLGHRIDKHIAEGTIWFTVDHGPRRFKTSVAALEHVRQLESLAV